jgi:hypothetical protein
MYCIKKKQNFGYFENNLAFENKQSGVFPPERKKQGDMKTFGLYMYSKTD